jgi:hypothetical protein
MINLVDITSKFCNVTMFLTVHLETTFHRSLCGMLIICLYTIFQIPISSSPLGITVNLTAKQEFCKTAMFLFLNVFDNGVL